MAALEGASKLAPFQRSAVSCRRHGLNVLAALRQFCTFFASAADEETRGICENVTLKKQYPDFECPTTGNGAISPLWNLSTHTSSNVSSLFIEPPLPAPPHHFSIGTSRLSNPSQKPLLFNGVLQAPVHTGVALSVTATVNSPIVFPLALLSIRHYARRRGKAPFNISEYLPPPEEVLPARASRPETPTLSAPPPFQGPENTPEMREKAQLFEEALLAFQQRGYLVHPDSPGREEQLKKFGRVFEIFGKHGFPVMRLQAALKWEVRHMEKARRRGGGGGLEERVGEVVEERSPGGLVRERGEGVVDPDAEQVDPPVFHTRAERKALRKAREEAAAAKSMARGVGSSDVKSNQIQTSEEMMGSLDSSAAHSEEEAHRFGASQSAENISSEEVGRHFETAGEETVGPGSPPESSSETGRSDQTETKGHRKKQPPLEDVAEAPLEGPYVGSLKGLVKGVGERGPFREFVRAPTQPAHRGGQGPGLTLRQKRLAAQIQKTLARVIANDDDMRGSLFEDGGFVVLEVRMTPELDTAYVRWTCNEGSQKQVEKKLGQVAGRLRTALFKELGMRFSPRLEFKYDILSEELHALEDAFDRMHDL